MALICLIVFCSRCCRLESTLGEPGPGMLGAVALPELDSGPAAAGEHSTGPKSLPSGLRSQ